MKIYGIHPADKNLNFLRKLNEDLEKRYVKEYFYLRLEPSYKSHEDCLLTLRRNESSTVFVFCHALDRSIRGCKIESPASGNSARDFNYGNFISPSLNIDVFKDKKVLCLACMSRDLGRAAIEAGAKVYLGFGEVEFVLTENFKEQNVINLVKEHLRAAMFNSIIFSIDNNLTFNELSIRISTSLDLAKYQLLSDQGPGLKIRIEAYRALSKIKYGMKMFGNGNIRMRDI